MFGGLTKTSSRIAIAAALGMTLGGFAMSATPAKAADLGGDCCADLEERVAELEATTVRKGNKKVSVTLSGWVIKSMNWWDDGHDSSFVVGDKDYDTTWQKMKISAKSNGLDFDADTKIWMAKTVPLSGMVKMEMNTKIANMEVKMTMELAGSGSK